jgi:indolepyruvate ferredoxin oxidoreductase beta subunit
LTTSGILARAALKSGVNVLTAETHGMAQRGGSVEVHVRMGDVHSPLIPYGSADVVISLELVEAVRYAHYISERTLVILNNRKIVPTTVSAGLAKYPEFDEVISALKEITSNIRVVDATKIAQEVVGNVVATNVVVIGMLAKLVDLPISYESIEETIKEVFPEKLVEANLKALKAGYEAV